MGLREKQSPSRDHSERPLATTTQGDRERTDAVAVVDAYVLGNLPSILIRSAETVNSGVN